METVRMARAAAVICIVGATGAVTFTFTLALLTGWNPANYNYSPFLVPIYLTQLVGVFGLALAGAAPDALGRVGVGSAAAGLALFVLSELPRRERPAICCTAARPS